VVATLAVCVPLRTVQQADRRLETADEIAAPCVSVSASDKRRSGAPDPLSCPAPALCNGARYLPYGGSETLSIVQISPPRATT
jgi:hypothetical protein